MQDRRALLARGTAALALLLAFAVGLYRVRTFDTFFHLAAGRYILTSGDLPERDPFSFTFPWAPWHDHSWGAQVLLERLHALGGFAALSLFQATLAVALLAIAARSPWASALGLLPMFAYREVIEARPHLIGFVCLASMLTLMRSRGRIVLLAIPIYALWASAHGSHVLAFLCMGLALMRKDRVHWAISLACCVALMFPLAPGALGQGGQHLASSFLEGNVSEWYPVTSSDLFGTWPGRTFLLIVVLSIVGATKVRDVPSLVAFVVLLALGFSSRRMLALFALGAMPLWLPWASATLDRVNPLAALAAVVAMIGLLPFGPFEPGVGLASDRFPEAAVAWLRQHPELRRPYNAYNYGGYLMWSGFHVFVDGRAITVYPAEFLERFERAYDDPREFEALRSEYGADSALMPTASTRVRKLRSYLREHWRLRHADAVAEIYTPQ